MLFDIKIEGHMTHTLDIIAYSSVIIIVTLHIALTVATLHDLEVKAADLLNAFVMAPTRENIWTVLDPEFGDDAGKSSIIVRAL